MAKKTTKITIKNRTRNKTLSRRYGVNAPIAGGTRKWSGIRREATPERRHRIDAIKKRMEASERLFEVRKELGITQADVADRLGVSQGNVSDLERREDALVSTVRAYIEALGGELEIVARFGERKLPVDLRSFAALSDEDAAAMNVGPLLEDLDVERAGIRTAETA